MKTWLYRLRPTRPGMLLQATAAEVESRKRHFGHVQRLCADGVVLLAGRTQDLDPEGMGLVIFRAEDESAARALMESDPGVAEGLMQAKLFPYSVALFNGAALEEAGRG